MTTICNGKRYDSNRTETLGTREHFFNGNYCGTTYIERASDGTLLILTESNGQSVHVTDCFYVLDEEVDFEGYDLSPTQLARCTELGYITEVP